jgi:hypothetical protein
MGPRISVVGSLFRRPRANRTADMVSLVAFGHCFSGATSDNPTRAAAPHDEAAHLSLLALQESLDGIAGVGAQDVFLASLVRRRSSLCTRGHPW